MSVKKRYILYDPEAVNGRGRWEAEVLEIVYENTVYYDITQIRSYEGFFDRLDGADEVILCGGDGTLNRFANDVRDISIRNPVYFYSIGRGNDFVRDLGCRAYDDPNFSINPYIERLPRVTVNGEERLFLNGVGFGVDGYCCEEGDRLCKKNKQRREDKPINDTLIAVKGLLFHFEPVNAKVTVDGQSYTYQKVWLAPTMNGRYYGGGMMPAPDQQRLGEPRRLTLMVMHGGGRLRTLMIFPSIYKGKHLNHRKYVDILCGEHITVSFDRPAPLQIDGETVRGVTEYTAAADVRKAVCC